jgi:quercetin dioxygenase-like cupin family protein
MPPEGRRLEGIQRSRGGTKVKRYGVVPPGGGPNYAWAMDHTFVKVSAGDTGGAFALMEDNLTAEFALGLHLHRQHAETFYVLEGAIDFYLDGDWLTAGPGTTVHIPPGVPHAVVAGGGRPAKTLMIFQPAGFDQYLAELARLDEAALADEARMEALALKYDIVNLGPVPARHPVAP